MKDPISIGELIVLLKHVEDQNAEVCFDFPGEPTFDEVESWRGVYAMPALSYKEKSWPPADREKVKDLISELELSTSGKVYTGWKGGDFYYNKDDFLHVANAGEVGNTVIVGVGDEGWRVVLLTEYQKDKF